MQQPSADTEKQAPADTDQRGFFVADHLRERDRLSGLALRSDVQCVVA